MLRILAIDPGTEHCGVAMVKSATPGDAGLVAWATLWKTATPRAFVDFVASRGAHDPGIVVFERMQIYHGSKQKGAQEDLVKLLVIGAQLAGATQIAFGSSIHSYHPHEWKGQLPKSVHHERIKKRLSPAELDRIELPKAKTLAHNVWDAVALGLYHLGRVDREHQRRARRRT